MDPSPCLCHWFALAFVLVKLNLNKVAPVYPRFVSDFFFQLGEAMSLNTFSSNVLYDSFAAVLQHSTGQRTFCSSQFITTVTV